MKETLKYQNNSIKSIKKQYFFVLLRFHVYHVYRDSSGALVTRTLYRNSFLNKFTSIRLPNIWIATRPGRSSHVSSKGLKLIEFNYYGVFLQDNGRPQSGHLCLSSQWYDHRQRGNWHNVPTSVLEQEQFELHPRLSKKNLLNVLNPYIRQLGACVLPECKIWLLEHARLEPAWHRLSPHGNFFTGLFCTELNLFT